MTRLGAKCWTLAGLSLIVACSAPAATTTSAPSPTVTATLPPATSTPPTTTTAVLAAPPWEQAALTEAPAVLIEQWEQAENRTTCAALSPEGGIEGAEPRAANFSGGWAVAWDAPDGPGMAADGNYCEDCGRSAAGVAGTGAPGEEAIVRSWPSVIEWSDGSLVGYGIEGELTDLPVTDPVTAGAGSPTRLAFLMVAGEDCLYNIWSRRSEAELLDVIDRLRFVEGLGRS